MLTWNLLYCFLAFSSETISLMALRVKTRVRITWSRSMPPYNSRAAFAISGSVFQSSKLLKALPVRVFIKGERRVKRHRVQIPAKSGTGSECRYYYVHFTQNKWHFSSIFSPHKAKKNQSPLFLARRAAVGREIASEISDRKELIDAFLLTPPDSTGRRQNGNSARELTKENLKIWKRVSSDSETNQPLTIYKIPGE